MISRTFGHENGYVALISVVIMGAISLAIGVSILTVGTDHQRSILVQQQSIQARSLANACAEEALQMLSDNAANIGSGTNTVGSTTCSYTTTQSGSNFTINATGIVGDSTRRIQIYATIGSSTISIISWQDVADAT